VIVLFLLVFNGLDSNLGGVWSVVGDIIVGSLKEMG
jgi:hypothetical protein